MKYSIHILQITAFIFVIFLQSGTACTIEIPSLRKEFRTANSVFVGKVLNVKPYEPTETEKEKFVSKNWQDWTIFSKVTFEIQDKFKGNLSKGKEVLAVAYFICGCDQKMRQYEVSKEYLVFTQKKNFLTICDSRQASDDWTKKDIKNLNSFGFRLWARIYPF